jgi:hypothetical protein
VYLLVGDLLLVGPLVVLVALRLGAIFEHLPMTAVENFRSQISNSHAGAFQHPCTSFEV